jgi:uncharacterized protein (DUF1501 family)
MHCTRRGFFRTTGAAALPLLAPRLAFAQDSKAAAATDTLVVVFQRGGMDALNAIVPHGDADYYRLRPTIGVPRPGSGTSAALDLDGYFGLNPALAPLLPLYQNGRLAAVHATGFSLSSRSHFDCQDFMERAALLNAGVSNGWLNRYLELSGVTRTFEAVGVGAAVPYSLRGNAPVIGLRSFAEFALRTQSARVDAIADTYARLYDSQTLLASSSRRALAALDELALANPGQYPVENGAAYPATTFGDQLKQVAQLVKAGVGLRVASLDIGNWDHHDNLVAELAPLLDELGRGLAAFDTDLGTRMAGVTLATMTEFGRRVQENASRGSDHGSGYGMLLMGGGVIGRNVYRNWPGLADNQLYRGDLAITTDYRTVLSELIEKRMGGSDLARVFPGFTPGPRLGAFVAR